MHYAFRFINILILFQDDQGIVWDNVRNIRRELGNFRASQPQFSINNNKKLMERLAINVSNLPSENVSEQILESGARMFIYLNFCPTEDFNEIYNFYETTINYLTTKHLFIIMSNILKSLPNSPLGKITAKIFPILARNLEMQSKNIEELVGIKSKDELFFGNCTSDNVYTDEYCHRTLRTLGFLKSLYHIHKGQCWMSINHIIIQQSASIKINFLIN